MTDVDQFMSFMIAEKFNKAKKMLKNGFDINSYDSQGTPPLIHAISLTERDEDKTSKDKTLPLKFILDNGADISISDDFGKGDNSLTIAGKFLENNIAINILIDYMKTDGEKLVNCAWYYLSNRVYEMIDNGADANASDSYGRTALLDACTNGDVDLINGLISRGADIHVEDQNGMTPLFESINSYHLEAVKLIIEKGASPSDKNKNNEDVFSYFSTIDDDIKSYLENVKLQEENDLSSQKNKLRL